jgi:hypothetical protein
VLTLYRRDAYGSGDKKTEDLSCDWPCPACGHKHRRNYKGDDLAEGRIEFVEEVEYTPLDPHPMVAYLAAPYSHPEPLARQARWLAASRAAACLMGSGLIVLSPLSMGHPISVAGAEYSPGTGFQAWKDAAMTMLRASEMLIVLTLDGWRESAGVAAEIAAARELGMYTTHLHPVGSHYVSCLPWQSDLPPEHEHNPKNGYKMTPIQKGIAYFQIPEGRHPRICGCGTEETEAADEDE